MHAKKFSSRIIAAVLSMMLVISCFAIPATIVGAASETKVNIHYLREDGNYGDWDVWAWADGLDGAAYKFGSTTDAHGAVTTVTITQSTPKLGFIIRKPDWSAKDPEPDRFVDLSSILSGTVEVYSISGQEEFTVDDSKAVKGMKVATATAGADYLSLDFTMTKKPDAEDLPITAADFSVTAADGSAVAIRDINYDNGLSGSLVLRKHLKKFGSYTVKFRGGSTAVSMPDYYSSEEFENKYSYLKDDLGADYSETETTFRVWAPTATKVELNLYDAGNGGTATKVTEMTKSVRGTWVLTVAGDLNGKYYTYNAYFDDGVVNKDIVDPYARTVGVNGQRGMILDLDSTDPEGWDDDQRHTYANPTDMSIYELHIRDFSSDEDNGITNKGKYIAFTETGTKTSKGIASGIDHLKDLGITSVHILPSYDYGSVDETKLDTAQYNWGYDPVNYNAPEGSYSTDPYKGEVRVKEYKQMVKALHDAGIGVIMDVVYNHTYNTQYCFNKLVPGYFYRPDSNASGCGNDVASERVMVSKFISDSVKYWADEYHLDGFRFDLMGLLDVDTMNNVRSEVDKVDHNILLYGEGWTMGTKVTKSGVRMATQPNSKYTPGIAYFSDTIRDAIRGNVFEDTESGYVGKGVNVSNIKSGVTYSKGWSASPDQTINYDSCHDNHTIWDRLHNTNPDDTEEDLTKMNKLAAAIIFTSQGVPFMMSGEEFLRTKTKEDGTFDHNSYASPDSVNKLDYNLVEKNSDVYNYYKGLIKMRSQFSELRMTTKDAVNDNLAFAAATAPVVAYSIKGNTGANAKAGEKAYDMFVVYNPNRESAVVALPSEGVWAVVANGEAAGTEVLNEVSGESVEVPALTAMVLVKDYTAPAESLESITDDETEISVKGVSAGATLTASSTATDTECRFTLDVSVDGAVVETFSAPVEVTLPYAVENCTITSSDGTVIPASYVDGAYVFTTTKLGTFKATAPKDEDEITYPDEIPGPDDLPDTLIPISGATVTFSGSMDYTGSAVKPAVTVKDGNTVLSENDYTVSYSNNTKAGTAKATITGKGDYTGTLTKEFTIKAKAVSKLTIKLAKTSVAYTGSAQKVAVTVKNGSTTLKLNTDYTLKYSNNTKAGKASVKITGKGNFSGSATKTFTITKASIAKAKVTGLKSAYAYTGKAQKPKVTVKLGTKTLKLNTDYTVTYKNNKKTGKATVTITGKTNYTGKITKNFNIKPAKLNVKSLTTPKAKNMKVAWKKDSNATGYQITYSTKSNFKSSKSVSITKAATTSKTISGLKSKTTYYVKIRAYKTISGKKVYGDYGSVKKIKVK